MNDLRTAAQQALDAMENCRIEYDYHGNPMDEENANLLKAIDTLRAALADEALDRMAEHARETGLDYGATGDKVSPTEPVQERDEWTLAELAASVKRGEKWKVIGCIGHDCAECKARQPQKPVAYWHKRGQEDEQFIHAEAVNEYCPVCEPLYTAPPQRKPLSDEEIDRVTFQQWGEMKGYPLAAHRAYARAIERAHGIIETKIQGDKDE